MDDLKKLSVERLRELARKHLGKGHSRFRTKAQLLEALKDVVRAPLSRLLDAAESVIADRTRVRVVDFPRGRRGRVRAPAVNAPPTERAAGPGGRRSTAPPPPASGAAETARRATTRAGTSAGPPTQVEPPAPGGGEMVTSEDFFQTPAAPRRAARAPVPGPAVEAEPLALPREVGTEAPLLLVRDPTTLFVFWDFRRELERGAALGLREPRLLLRLYRGEDLDRSLELPLSSRSVYVTGLQAGHEYTAEVLLLGRDGWTRPVGSRSAARRLPPGRVSSRLEVRTLRLPWSEPLPPAPAASTPSMPRHEPLDSPRRVPLPTSPGAQGAATPPAPSGGPRSGRN